MFLDRHPAWSTRVYINNQHGGCWYTLNDELQPQIIHSGFFRGAFIGCDAAIREYKGKENLKFSLRLRSDDGGLFDFEVSPASVAGRSLIQSLGQLAKDKRLKEGLDIVLGAKEGESDKVVLLSVYAGGSDRRVFCDQPFDEAKSCDWAARLAYGFNTQIYRREQQSDETAA